MRLPTLSAVLLVGCLFPFSLRADDWPQWLGPNRDSVWREEGIVEQFPDDGLQVKWRTPVGLGYGGPAVADGRVYVMDYQKRAGELGNSPGKRDVLDGTERVLCFDAATGELLWKHEYDRPYAVSYGGGPRCTPTVDGDRVYALGAEGDLTCLDAKDGRVIWKRNFPKDYGVETPIWGFAAHPLVDGDLVYCVVGGEGSVAVAFNKHTGKEVWRALSAREPGYCPPTIIEHSGIRQLIIWHPESINSLHPKTGELYWSVPLKPSYSMSINVPRLLGDRLYASGIGNVAAMLELGTANGKPTAEVLWRGATKKALYGANSTPLLEDGVIYGNDCRSGALIAARMEDGERLWETFDATTGDRRANHATVFLVKHNNRHFLFNEKGDLILAKLTPKGYQELGRFRVLEPTNSTFGRSVVWSHPAFAQKCLFARNDKELVCVSLAE